MLSGYHEAPVEPLVPKSPVRKLITDESARVIDTHAAGKSNITIATSDESTMMLSSAVIGITLTLATLLAAAFVCLVSISEKLDILFRLCHE